MGHDHPTFPVSRQPFGEPHEDSVADLSNTLEQSQSDIEHEKVALARLLHDDLGGLLVGAIMDIGWVSQQSGHSGLVSEKLARAMGLLRAAIDMKRELIENLRPTLLDNVGLFSTLRWHLKASCDAVGVPYSENLPSSEIAFSSDLKIAVFRIFQEALKHVLSNGTTREVEVEVQVEVICDNHILHCQLKSTCFEAPGARDAKQISPEISMRHRVQRIGGAIQWLQSGGDDDIQLRIPFAIS
jgi:signal transduction histidine kinase